MLYLRKEVVGIKEPCHDLDFFLAILLPRPCGCSERPIPREFAEFTTLARSKLGGTRRFKNPNP